MEPGHEQPGNLPGLWWLMALNIISLCFTYMLSRYGAEGSTGCLKGQDKFPARQGQSVQVEEAVGWA